jgi:EAL domain-containing protein (putative c-di-GMP-specific phosphodiesterase class I)/DNA-binding NarL/FixJ family response regulator
MEPHTHTPYSAVKTILLALETPQGVHRELESTLTRSGHTVLRTELDAIESTMRTNPPDLVLIEASQEGDQALEICRSLSKGDQGTAPPVVLLCDGASAEWTSRACDAGATEFLESGIPPALLERRLDGAIAHVSGLLSYVLSQSQAMTPAQTIAEPSSFPRLVDVSIEQCRATDMMVCVLAVTTSAGSALPENLSGLLNRAVREFEQEGPISHPKGSVVISRLSPDCIAVLIPELSRIQDAARIGYKLQDYVRQNSDASQSNLSVGVATSPGDSNDGNTMVQLAREAASIAEQGEGSSLNFRTDSTNRWVFERLTLERSLRNAIENDELVVFYQPKLNIQDCSVIGFEALVRWQHPELGMVSPAQFIPLAEETGLIVPIGEWVLETACKQARAWTDAGYPAIRMAVNLSPVQFRKPDLCDTVMKIVERSGLPASLLELEVTESMLMHNLKETIQTLQRLKATGIYLSIDDFGTGYSSLSYLKGFPIDALKIDRSFVRDITANPDDAAIATSIILMGRSLNLNVIAEGVETESQRAFLQVLQCNEFQGYLFSPPVPADKAVAFLVRKS